MDSRSRILQKLRAAPQPFRGLPPFTERQPMSPVEELSPTALQARFVREAGALGFQVTCCPDTIQALDVVIQLIAPDKMIQSWALAHVPLPGLGDALAREGITVASDDPTIRVGLTGVDAALAGTGSLILMSGPGRPRYASLVPPVHIAVVAAHQIVPHLEAWAAAQHADDFQHLRAASSVVVISGPSRTGDIANIPVRGVHGPGTVHIVIVQSAEVFP